VSGDIVYGTKIGDIFWIPLMAVSLLMIIIAIYSKGLWIFFLLTTVVIDVVLIYAGFRTKYVFESDRLVVRMPFQVSEPPAYYDSVKRVVFPGTQYYSHGFSRDTIGIYYGEHGYVSISPVRKEEFIEVLRARCPQARFEPKDSI